MPIGAVEGDEQDDGGDDEQSDHLAAEELLAEGHEYRV